MKNEIKKIKEPKLTEISFEGNMPSTYEKRLRAQIKKRQMQRK